ncbi:MAG TPA: PAS domain-containing sensor histidine kinase [Desulfotomaculum sp.]|nr:PAS domain-containing sensor histidine kinase [Desulfotomaculum sp.]
MFKMFGKSSRSISWRPLAGYFIMLFVFYAAMEFFAGDRVNAWAVVLVALPFAIALSWVLLKRILEPLAEISEAAREMALGYLDREIRIHHDDELGVLARNINLLGRKLRQTIYEITEEKDRMGAVLNSMADGVIAVDGDGRVLLVNPVVEKALNISGEQCRGKDIVGVIRHLDFEKSFQTALKTQEDLTREIQVLTPDPRYYRVNFTPLKGTGRGGVVAIFRDITERRQLDQIRAEFIANVSHELRTPLTSIRGFLETLLDGAVEDRETSLRFLKIIDAETGRMTGLIGDLFSLSNIESGKVAPVMEEIKMAGIIDKVFSIFSHAAGERDIKLVSGITADFPVIAGDTDMITRVFINLVDNAIKYSQGGGEVTITGGPAVKGEVFIRVADRGIGIPDESLSRIFERLYRVDKARSREYGGSGLGLAIVKHILEAHHGRIEVSSRPGLGSTFTVYLPQKQI